MVCLVVKGKLGQSHGSQWKELGRNVISHIFVYFDEISVISVSFGFIENGALVLSKPYGLSDTSSCSVRIVRLNHETEFVTGLSGEWTSDFITCLTFHTNEKVHEAFCSTSVLEEKDVERKEFYSGIHDRSQFEGFFGTFNSSRLLSIGFQTKHVIQGVNTLHREVWPL